MHEEISDTRLQAKFKKAIARNKNDMILLKSFLYCGSRVIHQTGVEPAVFVLGNGEKTRFFGQTTCKNSWACPVCSARMMTRYATEISCAIEALKEWHNQKAFMITFTIPHTSGMSCLETTEILYSTWKDFITHGNKTVKANNEKGKKKRWQQYDPFTLFCETFNCKHRVRVGEYTWGENGWHPHFHCLFWVDADKLQHVKYWQESLEKRWLELAKRKTIAYWNKRAGIIGNRNVKVSVGLGKTAYVSEALREGVDDAKKNQTRADIMYSRLNSGSSAVYISVDDNGRVIEQKSSMYICGWGADRELTGNYQDKATKKGHYTPHQLLEMATTEPNDKYMNLYMDFARTIRLKKHMRINFSTRSGIKSIIAKWKLTNTYKEVLKKKATTNPNAGMSVVCWFKEFQWLQICLAERTDENIKVRILELAKLRQGKEEIEKYLLEKGIDITKNKEHHLRDHINGMFASAA